MVIHRHLHNLLDWGCFPTLRPTNQDLVPTCDPFSAQDFIKHVLIPEASILLIIDDKDYPADPEHLEPSKEGATTIWKNSREYGKWQVWGTTGDDIEKAMAKRRAGWKETVLGERCRKAKKEVQKKVAKKAIVISDSESAIGLSQISQASMGTKLASTRESSPE